MFPVQTPLCGQPGFGAQPCYKAPGDLQVIISQTLTSVRLPPPPPPTMTKVGCGAVIIAVKKHLNGY